MTNKSKDDKLDDKLDNKINNKIIKKCIINKNHKNKNKKKNNKKKNNKKKNNINKNNINKNNINKNNINKDNIPDNKIDNKIIETVLHYHKETIPKRVRELVWTTHNGETFTNKCFVTWCENKINVFNFQVGHDIPESKGGTLEIDNLKPICGNCNLSMGNKHTITEWCKLVVNKKINILNIFPVN